MKFPLAAICIHLTVVSLTVGRPFPLLARRVQPDADPGSVVNTYLEPARFFPFRGAFDNCESAQDRLPGHRASDIAQLWTGQPPAQLYFRLYRVGLPACSEAVHRPRRVIVARCHAPPLRAASARVTCRPPDAVRRGRQSKSPMSLVPIGVAGAALAPRVPKVPGPEPASLAGLGL